MHKYLFIILLTNTLLFSSCNKENNGPPGGSSCFSSNWKLIVNIKDKSDKLFLLHVSDSNACLYEHDFSASYPLKATKDCFHESLDFSWSYGNFRAVTYFTGVLEPGRQGMIGAYYQYGAFSGTWQATAMDYRELTVTPLYDSISSLTDTRDGQQYKTVKFGGQWWMAENLNHGKMIQSIENGIIQKQRDNDTVEKFCYGNVESDGFVNGGLYSWDEAMGHDTVQGSQGICPDGWHLPSDPEWKKLEEFLGMVPGRLDDWEDRKIEGVNFTEFGNTGFNVFFTGHRDYKDGRFYNRGVGANFWTSTSYNDSLAYRRVILEGQGNIVYRRPRPKAFGMQVRCIKDK